MNIAEVEYAGQLRTKSVHLSSSQEIITDAPPDNHGKGEAFSPTDLLSTSLACCMFTLMGITANKHEFEFLGGRAEVEKHMTTNPRSVGKIAVLFLLKGTYPERQRQLLEAAALNCPVAKSLSSKVVQEISFQYGS